MSTPKSMKELADLYPYQLKRRDAFIGVDVAVGWFEKFVQLCAEIDRRLGPDKHGFQWVQIKEKFGSARAHFQMDVPDLDEIEEDFTDLRGMVDSSGKPLYPDLPPVKTAQEKQRLRELYAAVQPLQLELRNLVCEFTRWSDRACIVCGEPGQADNSKPYILVLCPKHTADRKAGMLEPGSWWMD